jgi:ribonuclease HII
MKQKPVLWACGVDEAGRGPLAGPVYAAAVVLGPPMLIEGLDDSKKLSPEVRELLETEIRTRALAWSVAYATAIEVDALNILQASLLAMRRAVLQLKILVAEVLVDGNQCPVLPWTVRGIVDGDALVPEISAASILAKTARDRHMVDLDRLYPQYGFAQHKGYSTREHVEALNRFGATPEHRRSFAPVRAVLGLD